MEKNLRRFLLLVIVTFGSFYFANAQQAYKFSISLATGINKTGSISYEEQYYRNDNSLSVNILSIGSSRNRNYNFSIGYQPRKSISINGSIGVASYGFSYIGDVNQPRVNIFSQGGFIVSKSFHTSLLEVGLSASYRIAYNDIFTFIIRPGIAWYSNTKERTTAQIVGFDVNSNNYSAHLFTGIEIPISNNSFYMSIGLNTKVALGNFASSYFYEINFQPYAIGIQTAISYRFGNFHTIKTYERYNKRMLLRKNSF